MTYHRKQFNAKRTAPRRPAYRSYGGIQVSGELHRRAVPVHGPKVISFDVALDGGVPEPDLFFMTGSGNRFGADGNSGSLR